VFVAIIFLSIAFGGKNSENASKNEGVQSALQATSEVKNNLPEEPQARIEAIVKSVGDYEVTIWDAKSNMAKSTTKPPYEVVVNAGNGKIANCSYAKNIAVEIMKKLYTDKIAKDKISRVLFTSMGNLRVSLGSEDGLAMDWATAGPTNFWKVMMSYKSYEDETGALNQRTWGKSIGNDCN
jgi:hypothetical protein